MPTVVGHIDEAFTEQTIGSAACTYVLAALLLLPQQRPEVPMQDSNPILSVPHRPTIDVVSHIQTELALADALRSIPLTSSPYQPPVYTEAAAFMLNIEYFLHVWGIGDRVVSQDIPPACGEELILESGMQPADGKQHTSYVQALLAARVRRLYKERLQLSSRTASRRRKQLRDEGRIRGVSVAKVKFRLALRSYYFRTGQYVLSPEWRRNVLDWAGAEFVPTCEQ